MISPIGGAGAPYNVRGSGPDPGTLKLAQDASAQLRAFTQFTAPTPANLLQIRTDAEFLRDTVTPGNGFDAKTVATVSTNASDIYSSKLKSGPG